MKHSITRRMIVVVWPVLAVLLAAIPANGAVNVTEHHNHDSQMCIRDRGERDCQTVMAFPALAHRFNRVAGFN